MTDQELLKLEYALAKDKVENTTRINKPYAIKELCNIILKYMEIHGEHPGKING